VALNIDEKLVASRYLTDTKSHSECLAPAADEVLAEQNLSFTDLSGVAVGIGPGSFIGSRIGLSYAKGVCVALDIPLVGISTLAAFACEPSLPFGEGYAVIDARRGEFYAQKFTRASSGVNALDEAHLVQATQIEEIAAKSDFVAGLPAGVGPSAEGLHAAFLSLVDLTDQKLTLVPQYVRDPDAKPQADQPLRLK
jgi:tRNA threonylcarbamoyl adenosine modification protein YeaZ